VRAGRRAVLAAVVAGLWAGCAVGPGAGPSVDAPGAVEVEAGLREALQLGVERTVVRTARRGGFAGDPQLHIQLPAELLAPAEALREAGMGWAADDLEASLNRSAELTAAGAGPLLADAVAALPLEEPSALLRAPPGTVTERLRDASGSALREELRPVAAEAMVRSEVEQRYLDLSARLVTLSIPEDGRVDLDDYLLDQTLDGLFAVLAQEETRIREQPAARTTERLQRVFGAR